MNSKNKSINFWKFGTVALILLLIFAFSIFLIKNLHSRPDVSLFVDEKSVRKASDDCKDSLDELCVTRPSNMKIEKYCQENKLSLTDCNKIREEVNQQILYYQDKYIEETKQLTEKILQQTYEMRQNTNKR